MTKYVPPLRSPNSSYLYTNHTHTSHVHADTDIHLHTHAHCWPWSVKPKAYVNPEMRRGGTLKGGIKFHKQHQLSVVLTLSNPSVLKSSWCLHRSVKNWWNKAFGLQASVPSKNRDDDSPSRSPSRQTGRRGRRARCSSDRTCRGTPWETSGCSSGTGTEIKEKTAYRADPSRFDVWSHDNIVTIADSMRLRLLEQV